MIKAYKIKRGKKTLAYTNYEGVIDEYRCPGLTGRILNDGDGENHSNTLRKVYLYISSYYGVDPQGAVIYRKAEGDKVQEDQSEKVRKTRLLHTWIRQSKLEKLITTRRYIKKSGARNIIRKNPKLL